MADDKTQEPRASLLGFMFPLLLIWTAFLIWNSKKPAPPPPANNLCPAQMQSIGQAVEAYAAYHQGRFPEKLDVLMPLYLPSIPECEGKDYRFESAPGRFTLTCPGTHGSYVYPQAATPTPTPAPAQAEDATPSP